MSPSALKLSPSSSILVVVDIQDKLAAAMPEAVRERTIRSAANLIEGARALGVPVIVTEQYPKGLGHTVQVLQECLERATPNAKPIEKLDFSAVEVPEFRERLRAAGSPTHAIVTGMESHICVYQTVRDLRELGLEVHVPMDAVASRTAENMEIAKGLYERVGGVVTSSEAVLFDWLGRAGGEAFKTISKLIR